MVKKIAVCFVLFAACSGCVSQEQLVRYKNLRAREAELTRKEISAAKETEELHRRYNETANKEPVIWYQVGSDLYDSWQWLSNL